MTIAATLPPALRRSRLAGMTIPAIIFGIGMAGSFTAGWIALGRVFTERTMMATAFIGLAGLLAYLLAGVVAGPLRRQARHVRFAAIFLILVLGTIVIAAGMLGVERAVASHALAELPLKIVVLILAIMAAGSLYAFLSIAGWLMLPLALPLAGLAAWTLSASR